MWMSYGIESFEDVRTTGYKNSTRSWERYHIDREEWEGEGTTMIFYETESREHIMAAAVRVS
jgi:hypothetical protein